MSNILNAQTALKRKSKGETFNLYAFPSKTVPNQSMSVYEVMQRYAAGLPIEGQKVPIYNGDEWLPDMSKLDLVDRHELLDNARQEANDLQQKYQKEQAAKKAAKNSADQKKLLERSGNDFSGQHKPAASDQKSEPDKKH